MYGIPQAVRLANDLLCTRLNNYGYYETTTTPGLWRHKWRPIMFVLIVDDFSIEYVGENHLHHLRTVLTKHYTITEDLEVKKNSGIDLKWNYTKIHAQRTCRLSMEGYIANLLFKYGHKSPAKPQLSPHRHHKINYGSKEQLVAEEDTSPKLKNEGIKRVQAIVGALFYYAWAVHNRLLVGLSAIGAQQASATEQTEAAIDHILDHVEN